MSKALLALSAAGAAIVPMVGAAAANAAISTAYVSPLGSSAKPDKSCSTAGFSSINNAIGAVSAGGTVVVCRGVYHTQAVVNKPLRLIGRRAVINAAGQQPVLPKLPAGSGIVVLQAHNVIIRGFTVVDAGFDAVLVGRSSHVQVSHNVLLHNGGVGVDFNGTSWSQADRNISEFNAGGGFLVADDVGASHNNAISWNVASRNPGGCGVIIAGHSTAGVEGNLVAHNLLTGNGTDPKSPGAGVVIATEVAHETVARNTVLGNTIYGNGLAGVTIHSHLAGQNLNGNRIIGNNIGTNNTIGDPIGLGPPVKNVPDTRATGILVGASSIVNVLIKGNHIHNNWFGIFIEGRVHVTCRGNRFRHVVVPVKFA